MGWGHPSNFFPHNFSTEFAFENRRNFSKRLIQRIQVRGEDPMIRYYYTGDFYQRALRYWCELNQRWTMSVHRLLPIITNDDPVFYQELQELWTEDYQRAAQKIYQQLFENDTLKPTPMKFAL